MARKYSLTRKQKFGLLCLIPVYFIIAGLCLQPIREIGPGLMAIIREPDFLITDYMIIGGIGAALVNAGLLGLVALGIPYFLDMEMDGHTIIFLSDVRVFIVWKKPFKYLDDPVWYFSLCQIP